MSAYIPISFKLCRQEMYTRLLTLCAAGTRGYLLCVLQVHENTYFICCWYT